MKQMSIVLALAAVTVIGLLERHAKEPALEDPTGSDVTLRKTDGVTVSGRLVEVQPDRSLLELRDGEKTPVPRAQIASVPARRDGAASRRTAATPASRRRPTRQRHRGRRTAAVEKAADDRSRLHRRDPRSAR